MPILKKITSKLDHFCSRSRHVLAHVELLRENRRDREKYRDERIERVFHELHIEGAEWGGFALTQSSIRALFFYLLKRGELTNVVELGAGQSTRFLSQISRHLGFSYQSIEHDAYWAREVGRLLKGDDRIVCLPLRSIGATFRREMETDISLASEIWETHSLSVPLSEYKNVMLENAFYDVARLIFAPHSIDALIVDGPHGNGRSIAFPLFISFLKPGCLILLDDYHHYPFLDHLARVARFKVLEKRRYRWSNKGWALLRLV